MIEKKTLKIAPSEEQLMIDAYQDFGWMLDSSQEIYSKDSHLERSGDKINSVTQTTNFVKLVLSRDTNMENYQRLKELSFNFEACLSKMPTDGGIKLVVAGVLLGGLALIGGFGGGGAFAIIAGFAIFAAPIVAKVLSSNKKKKLRQTLVKSINELREEGRKLL